MGKNSKKCRGKSQKIIVDQSKVIKTKPLMIWEDFRNTSKEHNE